MGKLTTQPEPTIHHFSHPHLLHLTTTHHHHHETLAPPPCSACKLQNSDPTYTCQTCPYTLHLACSQLPQIINHPSHHHLLKLGFSPPYYDKNFSCDICRGAGSDHWLYRCSLCEFDAHLSCANARPPVGTVQASSQAQVDPVQASSQVQIGPVQPVEMQNFQMPSRIHTPVGAPYAPTANSYARRPYVQNYPPSNPMILGNQGGMGQNNALMNQNNPHMGHALHGFFSGIGQAAEQQLSHVLMGGHGHGHNHGYGHGHGHNHGYGHDGSYSYGDGYGGYGSYGDGYGGDGDGYGSYGDGYGDGYGSYGDGYGDDDF